MPGKMPSGPDFSKPISPVEKKKRAPKPVNPLLKRKNIDTMTTRVMGMREGLELRREALAGEAVPSVEDQMAAHGVVETPAKTSQQEKMIRAANKAAENSIKNGATPAQVEMLKNGLINAITSGDEESVLSYSRSFNLLNKRNGAVVRSKTEAPKKTAGAGAEKPLSVAAQMEEHGVVDTTEEAEPLLKELALRNKKQNVETPLSEAQQEQMLVDAKKGISDLSLSLHEKAQKIEKTSSHTPDDSITPKEVEKPAKPRKKVAALNMGPFATRNEGPIDAISEENEAKWTGETPPKPEILGVDDPHDPVAQEDIHKWTGEKAPEAKASDEAAPKAEPAPTSEAAPKPADASIEEKEAALKELATKSMPKAALGSAPVPPPTTPPAPPAPPTPEELQTNLENARNAFAQASKEHEAARKQSRSFVGKLWEKVGGSKKDITEKSDAYKQASEAYQNAKEAIAHNKLSTDGEGRAGTFEFIENEMGEYQKLLSPEKQGLISRALQGYARMPAYKRVLVSLTISTVAMTSAIAFTGGFAGITAAFAFAGGRFAKAGLGAVVSTAMAESVGYVRNTIIDDKQENQKQEIIGDIRHYNIADVMSRMEELAKERQKFDKKTGIYKALAAGAVGGIYGLAYSLDMQHAGVINTSGTPSPAPVAPGVGGSIHVPSSPAMQPTIAPTGPTPPAQDYGNELPRAWPPAQGFGDELPKEWPPAQGFGDAQPLTPEAPAAAPEAAPVNPFSEPVEVTSADAKRGLWGILERRLTEKGVFTQDTPLAQKNATLATLENKLQALGPEKLRELGFRPGRSGGISIGLIHPGEKLDLSIIDTDTSAPIAASSEMPAPPTRPTVLTQPEAPAAGIKSDVPLPQPKPSFEMPADTPSSRTDAMPLNIHPDLASASPESALANTPTGSEGAENVTAAGTVEAIAQPLTPENVKGAWPLLAKGIMSKPADVTSNYYGTMNFKGLGLTFDQYKWLNNELIAARDTYKINFDNNKLVGAVLKELAEKRATSGKVLTA